tara:strand:+ start:18145 stop:18498 length:354 start_codon:yes stop_codon:yes gene_type:complete
LKRTIEITLAPIPYEHSINDLAGYLHMVGTELTGMMTYVEVNDYDFTDKVSVFKAIRRPGYMAGNYSLQETSSFGGGGSAIKKAASSNYNNRSSTNNINSSINYQNQYSGGRPLWGI